MIDLRTANEAIEELRSYTPGSAEYNRGLDDAMAALSALPKLPGEVQAGPRFIRMCVATNYGKDWFYFRSMEQYSAFVKLLPQGAKVTDIQDRPFSTPDSALNAIKEALAEDVEAAPSTPTNTEATREEASSKVDNYLAENLRQISRRCKELSSAECHALEAAAQAIEAAYYPVDFEAEGRDHG